ncbi:MAG: RNase adapter RapZ [Alphaproteobacteria bacterium]|nr:RNase adapter RapZ [Alphaproteobacteria bacterium]
MPKHKLIFVTGLSGAGMSSALKALEDIGYEVIDNFPLALLESLLKDKSEKPIAIGIDSRTRNFSATRVKKAIKAYEATLCFITCKHSVLQKRFTETRRKHPLAKDRPVSDGINKEMELLAPLKEAADLVMDTTDLSIHDLRRMIEGHYLPDNQQKLSVTLTSFGFKNGVPREADIVMDVRFLKNPHWDKKLKKLTGQNKAVGSYIKEDESFEEFIENFQRLIEPLLKRYSHEGKSYLTIAIGCTGGKHRSVFVVEILNKWLKKQGISTHIRHRDMPI